MPQLSAFLITKNESSDIAGCLESLRGIADEIIVIDDHSTDDTVTICRRLGAQVFTRSLEGFAAQKQYALDQTTGVWALSIDADERLTPALVEEIRTLFQTKNPPFTGFEIQRNFYFLGHRLRFGGVGADRVVRLFRRDKGRYRDLKVHESIEITGAVGRLKNPLDHYSYANLEEYIEKCNHYTTLAAEDQWKRGRRFSAWDHLRPAWELVLRVLIKGAWLDGHAGLTYAALSAHAAWLRSIKLRELEKNQSLAKTTTKETIVHAESNLNRTH